MNEGSNTDSDGELLAGELDTLLEHPMQSSSAASQVSGLVPSSSPAATGQEPGARVLPAITVGRGSGGVVASGSDTRLTDREVLREELGRLMHSASQPKQDLRHAFYVDPQKQMSKHHLHSEDVDSHHRTGDFPHAWHPLGLSGSHTGKRRDGKGHHKSKHDHSKPSDKDKDGTGMRDVLSAPQLSQKHPDSVTSNKTADTLDSGGGGGGGGGGASSQDIGFYIGEPPGESQTESATIPRAASSELTPTSAGADQKVTFHLGDLRNESTELSPEAKDSPRQQMAEAEAEPVPSSSLRHRPHKHHRHHRRRHHHVRIPVGDELENRQRLGSVVQLSYSQPRVAAGHEESIHLGDADLDDLTSHRFSESRGLRRRRISHFYAESSQIFGSPKDLHAAIDHSPHELFVELEELNVADNGEMEWLEKARWIKFEEDVEEGTDRWGRPHVASLSFHSLLELRHCIEQGVVALDMNGDDMLSISCAIVDKLIIMDQLDTNKRTNVLNCLISKHKHVGQRDEAMRRNSSIFNLYALDRKTSNATVGNMQAFGRHTASSNKNMAVLEEEDSVDAAKKDLTKSESKTNQGKGEKVHFSNDVVVYVDSDGEKKTKETTVASSSPPSTAHMMQRRDTKILGRIPTGAESMAVMVGAVDFLDREMTAFIRLTTGHQLDNLVEVPLPVRFIFLLLGPSSAPIHYHEVGRSIATLMANKYFQLIAYKADDRTELLDAINEFLDDSLVLPPGDWDRRTLLPIMEMARKKRLESQQKHSDQTKLVTEEAAKPDDIYGDPLQRTKRVFGGLINDVKRRYPWYWSDIKDGLNFQCLATFFFIYFACLAPAITFGGLLGEKTEKLIGVSEMLVMTAVGGVLFSLLSAQPLTIIGATGPVLVFEESLYRICVDIGIEYLPMRFWVYIWMAVIFVVLVMFEGSFLVRYFTRFTEEIFSSLISLIFIYEVFYKLYKVFQRHPLVKYYPSGDIPFANETLANGYNTTNTTNTPYLTEQAQPNTALLSLVLTFATFLIAYFLKLFRNSSFLGRMARRALGDFGIPIAIFVMVLIDYLLKETYTEKLDVPDGLTPTAADQRGWFINPLGMKKKLPVWAMFAAIVPAILIFILIFMESLITSLIVNKKERCLKKGSGYHLDLLLIGLLATLSGAFGLPPLSLATVRSVTHVSALSIFSRTHAPGETPKLEGVMEQRMTGIAVHIMIGVSVLMGPVLRQVPLAVLFGVFLYMGIASMMGVQLFERAELLFMPVKHHPQKSYVRHVRTRKMHLYTIIQLVLLAILWAVKSTDGSLAFPFVLILTVPIRKHLLKYIFTDLELNHLDGDAKEVEFDEESSDEPDFYQQAHMTE